MAVSYYDSVNVALFLYLSLHSILVAESYTGSKISLKEDHGINGKMSINSDTWEPIEKLHKGEGWPRSEAYVQKRYEELKNTHQSWPDRFVHDYFTLSCCVFLHFLTVDWRH